MKRDDTKWKNFMHNYKSVIIICFIALIVRGAFFIIVEPWNSKVTVNIISEGDAPEYHIRALKFIKDGSFSSWDTHLKKDRTRTPGYPLFLAFIYVLFGVKIWIVLLLQILLDIGTVIMIYLIAKNIFNNKYISLISAFLYSINFLSAYRCLSLHTEVFFNFVFYISIYYLIKTLKNRNLWGFGLSGILLGIATLIRPILQYFPIIVCIIIFMFNRSKSMSNSQKTNEGRKKKILYELSNIFIFLASFLITLSPWQIRNLMVFNHYALSTIQDYNLLYYNAAITKANVDNISLSKAWVELQNTFSIKGIENPFERGKIYRKVAIKYIKENFPNYLLCHLKGCLNIFIDVSKEEKLKQILGLKMDTVEENRTTRSFFEHITRNIRLRPILLFLSIVEYIFAIIGFFACVLERNNRKYGMLFFLIILYFVVLTGPPGNRKFKIPIVPSYLTMSGVGVVATLNYVKRKRLKLNWHAL